MNVPTCLRHSGLIARIEWTRHRRDSSSSEITRRGYHVALSVLAVGLCWIAYSFGRDLASGAVARVDDLWVVATVAFGVVIWRSAVLIRTRFERLEPEFLLTGVSTRVAAVGLLLFVTARAFAALAAPTIGVAVGLALGLRSPTVAVTIVVAVTGLVTLAVTLGAAGRLAILLVGRRLVQGGRYRDLLVVFGWIPLLVVVLVLRELSVSVLVPFAWLDGLPVAWFVDLALLGANDLATVDPWHGLSALGTVLVGVPLFAGETAALARRIWETEPVDKTAACGSKSLLAEGRLERCLTDRVSRPTLMVARARWLTERRVPRGVLSTGYVLLFAAVILLPVFSIAGLPLLLLIGMCLGLAAGIVPSVDPIGVEYRTLPLLLTTVDGRQFVGGLLLAALGIGLPLVTMVVLPLGLASSAGIAETVGVVLVGVAVCACTAAVCVATGMDADRDEFVPVPFFFTDVPVYAQTGSVSFVRLGAVFAIVSLVTLPAVLGNAPSVYEAAGATGLSMGAVRLGSLLLTVLVAAGVSRIAFRMAVRRFRTYRL